jgi:hypothetical protein
MKIIEAHKLLSEDGVADHARYFNDLYKQHEFKETEELKQYFDFVLHEPVLWLKSFPSKLRSKPAFSKPKTAILKLLRSPEVISVYGKSFCENAHEVIDSVYKKNVDAILETRKEHKEERDEHKEIVRNNESFDEDVQPIPNKMTHLLEHRTSPIVPRLIVKDDEMSEIESIVSMEHVENISHIQNKSRKNSDLECCDEKSECEEELRELQKKYRTLKKAYEELAKGTLDPSVVASIQTLMTMI